ncbi:MAG: alpha/beta hydrolase [Anaerolineales bacterium]|nr:alpha/beta hydrolase [Anaerolineales bacterium]MCL4259297.1 alpha/beta hydrolase [Anaerolineales bacterium]
MSFSSRDEIEILDAAIRASTGGTFIQLSDGITHYEIGGSEANAPVILIHGFSVPSFIYDPTFKFLSQAGLQILRYDLFGRGLSDRPPVRNNLDFFLRQLTELMEALRFTRKVHLVGLSMGGLIASAFAVRRSERIASLVLIDPSGAKALDDSWALGFARIPVLSEIVFGQLGERILVNGAAKDLYGPVLVARLQEQFRLQMRYRGFTRSILSTIRNGMLDAHLDIYRALGKLDLPTLLFWGRNDRTIPFEQSDLLRQAIPNIEFHIIEDCGHIPHYEKPNEVNPILLNFLRRS